MISACSFSCEVQHTPAKRCFDLFFAIVLLILSFPLFLLIGLIIFCSDLGPIFYADLRVGRGGRVFRCYKFRSMHIDAQSRLKALLKEDPAIAREWESSRKLRHDPRITFIGLLLRKSSLDELPQLWNVLCGQMSFVGPRPVTEEELVFLYQEKAAKILQVRPGITGLWQVSGRSHTSYQMRVALDEQYVNERSWRLDGKILLSTIPAVLFVRGAY